TLIGRPDSTENMGYPSRTAPPRGLRQLRLAKSPPTAMRRGGAKRYERASLRASSMTTARRRGCRFVRHRDPGVAVHSCRCRLWCADTSVRDTDWVTSNRADLFISHAGADRAWAEWVAWQLELARYRVVLDVWDWAAGQNFVTAISDALERCER